MKRTKNLFLPFPSPITDSLAFPIFCFDFWEVKSLLQNKTQQVHEARCLIHLRRRQSKLLYLDILANYQTI